MKALPLALEAVASASKLVPLKLDIIGDGPKRAAWGRYAERLRLNEIVQWHGRVAHQRAREIIAESDCMLFTSLQEATSTVIMEALECGIPVICHDACGMGTAIDSTCGIKVPVHSPQTSVAGFAAAIVRLAQNRQYLSQLSLGAFERAEELSWDSKAKEMLAIYQHVVGTKSLAESATE